MLRLQSTKKRKENKIKKNKIKDLDGDIREQVSVTPRIT